METPHPAKIADLVQTFVADHGQPSLRLIGLGERERLLHSAGSFCVRVRVTALTRCPDPLCVQPQFYQFRWWGWWRTASRYRTKSNSLAEVRTPPSRLARALSSGWHLDLILAHRCRLPILSRVWSLMGKGHSAAGHPIVRSVCRSQ